MGKKIARIRIEQRLLDIEIKLIKLNEKLDDLLKRFNEHKKKVYAHHAHIQNAGVFIPNKNDERRIYALEDGE